MERLTEILPTFSLRSNSMNGFKWNFLPTKNKQ